MRNSSWAVTQNYGPGNPYGGYPGTGRIIVPKPRSRIKLALPVSNTRTRTKTESKTKWSLDYNTGLKYKNVNIKYKPSKIAKFTKMLSQPGNLYGIQTGGNTSGVGIQSMAVVAQTLGADIGALHTAINDNVSTTTPRSSEKLLFSGTKDEIEFNNMGPTTIELEIYVIIDKTSQTVNSDPAVAWDTGITTELNDVASLPAETKATPWDKPTTYKVFNINFWTKRYPLTLTAGEKCKFTLNFKRNRILDTTYTGNFTTIRGITHKIFVVQRGTLVEQVPGKSVAAATISLSETKVIWIWKNTLYGRLLSTLPKVSKQKGTALPLVLTAQWHLDEDTGEPEDANLAAEFA